MTASRRADSPAGGHRGSVAEEVVQVVGVVFFLGENVLDETAGSRVRVADPPHHLLIGGDHDALGGTQPVLNLLVTCSVNSAATCARSMPLAAIAFCVYRMTQTISVATT